MNSHETLAHDELGQAIRQSLRQRVNAAHPPARLRLHLLLRAADQHRQRRWVWLRLLAEPAATLPPAEWQNLVWDHMAYFSLLRGIGMGGATFR